MAVLPGSRTRRTPRARSLSLLVLAACAVVAQVVPPARAQEAAPARSASAEWATDTHGDPWDYTNADDLQLTHDRVWGADNVRISDGLLRFDVEDAATLTFLFPGYPGELPTGREGMRQPIEAGRYTHAAVRMYTSALTPTSASLFWDRCLAEEGDTADPCRGRWDFIVMPGWQTYVLPLAALTADQLHGWSGLVHALRMSYGNLPGDTSAALDWVRVYRAEGTDPVAPAALWDGDDDLANNTPENPNWGQVASPGKHNDAAVFHASAYPEGTYRFFDGRGYVGEPLRIDQPPIVVFDDPDVVGGEDYATAQTGDGWDFSQPSDVVLLANAQDVTWTGDALEATNGPPAVNDPYFYLRLGPPIDASRYHRLTVTTSYEGPFGLADAPAGGTHARLSWTRADMDQKEVLRGNKVLQSKELVEYPGRHTYTVELKTDPAGSLMEDDLASRAGWTGSPVTHVRWDVNEDRGLRRWRIDDIALRADDESSGTFDVRWHDAHAPGAEGTHVSLYYDDDRKGFDGKPIATDLRGGHGPRSYRWDTRDVAPGTYWLYAVAEDGVGTSRRYASGPLAVLAPDGAAPSPTSPGTPGEEQEPQDDELRVAGDSRVATSVALSQTGFPSGTRAAVIARDEDFADALAAAPLAAAASGPLLLNPSASLHEHVGDELRRLGVGTVYLMGGLSAQSADVEQALRELPGVRVVRIAGANRYATAASAATTATGLWREAGHTAAGNRALVAVGTSFPDALAAGPLAAHAHRPLLLVHPDGVPSETLAALRAMGTEEVTVVGGPAVVPETTATQLRTVTLALRRIAGNSRFETARLVAQEAVHAGADPGVVVVASGRTFPDALSAGPASVAHDGVLLLTEPHALPEATRSWIAQRAGELRMLRVAGGSLAVSDVVLAALADAADA